MFGSHHPVSHFLQCDTRNIPTHYSTRDWLPVPGMSNVCCHFVASLKPKSVDATYCTPSCHASKGYGYEHWGIYLLAVRDNTSISEILGSHVLQYAGWYNRYHNRRSHHFKYPPAKTQGHHGIYYQQFRRFNQR